ncbi:uncharacterized protein LOC143774687 isoform X1 [Ranitomeya variabilis]|uniref:uncharacterized protein LOC143774687 isoform X1 n=2 Tax=Ranitomeya variabilis TaxID=490064 RepID=UPI00405675AC
MQNVYGTSSGNRVKTVCGISDDDADDYENVIDNRKVLAVPERLKKGNETTGKKDLQLKYMDQAPNSFDRGRNTTHGLGASPPFQPPRIGLDFSSPAVNAAFRDQQTVEQITGPAEKRVCRWKKMVLIFYLLLTFLFLILLTSIIFIYYSNISNQLAELKKNASWVQDSIKNERETLKENLMTINKTLVSPVQDSINKEKETWKENLMKMNQTLVKELELLKSDVKTIKKVLGLCTSCPAGWSRLGSSCYSFSTSHQTWQNSQEECRKRDSSLLILKSNMELDAVRPLTGNKRFWIGLKKGNGNTWLWVDGTMAVYTNWNIGEPNNAAQREHCTEMIAGGWNDFDCDKAIDYICQKTTTC